MVPEDVRAPLRHYLLEHFDINLNDETTKKCIDEQMRKAWKGHKYKLHLYFKEIGGENDLEMAKSKRHPDLKEQQQEDWMILCDRWCSPEYKVTFFYHNIAIMIGTRDPTYYLHIAIVLDI
ncbi:uncharacterized protein LOC133834170 [Humulus lupulus]|uniref:uncharacterized protein LOC133834170 n=1 Tax=Humulus lupulus TaxID=3486 RepID=UPI002B417E72|nr:uncharacterized protein LOC133834170 [Humulus lupulus]